MAACSASRPWGPWRMMKSMHADAAARPSAPATARTCASSFGASGVMDAIFVNTANWSGLSACRKIVSNSPHVRQRLANSNIGMKLSLNFSTAIPDFGSDCMRLSIWVNCMVKDPLIAPASRAALVSVMAPCAGGKTLSMLVMPLSAVMNPS